MWRIFGIVFFCNKDHFVAENGKSFNESAIKHFLTTKGIALYDTAEVVIRHKNNASDQFLEIVTPVDLKKIFEQIPTCNTIVTTGQKATETLMELIGAEKLPFIGGSMDVFFLNRMFRCYRMPSSSRAYPKSIIEKAAVYRQLFSECAML